MTKSLFKILGLSLVIFMLFSGSVLMGFDDDFGDFDDLLGDIDTPSPSAAAPSSVSSAAQQQEKPVLDSSLSEFEQIEVLLKAHSFTPVNPKKDPFKPILQKKADMPQIRRPPPTKPTQPAPPPPPPIKPLKLYVAGIVGNDSHRVAIVKYENTEYTISRDQVVEGKFKVIEVQTDRVVVFSNEENRRHTFKVGDE